MRNILTIDVEEYYHVGRPGEGPDACERARLASRVEADIDRVLELLEARSAKATFFVLGETARDHPDAIARVAAAGHEIASHGYHHLPVDTLTPEAFGVDIDRSIDVLAACAGRRPAGYRAPIWSLSRAAWGLDALIERGFRYDSSFAPVPPLGDASLPARPVVLRRGAGSILELPPLSARLGRWRYPVGFAMGLRLLPEGVIHRAIERENREGRPAIVAMHPWELDPDPPALRLAPSLALAHGFGLERLADRIGRLLSALPFDSVEAAISPGAPWARAHEEAAA